MTSSRPTDNLSRARRVDLSLKTVRSALALALVVGSVGNAYAEPKPAAARQSPVLQRDAVINQVVHVKPKYKLAIQFVRLADDNGSNASTLTHVGAQAAVNVANEVWARNGGDILFEIHPASDFDGLVKSTLLNHDCLLAPGQTAASIATNKNPDLNSDGVDGNEADANILCNKTNTKAARVAYGLVRSNRIVVFSRSGYEKVTWNKKAKHWELTTTSGGSSSAVATYINMPAGFGDSTALAHELGHYLHVLHTFGPKPSSLDEAGEEIESWIASNPDKDPAETFNGDANAGGDKVAMRVFDTPPDPTGVLWKSVFGKRCEPADHTLMIPYKVGALIKNAVLSPDRSNVMSYFKGCTNFKQHLSKEQLELARRALNYGNRQDLWRGKSNNCYRGGSTVLESGLIVAISKIAACKLLTKDPPPWETVMQNVYINPSIHKPGFVRRGNVGVNLAAEKALIDKLLNTPMLD